MTSEEIRKKLDYIRKNGVFKEVNPVDYNLDNLMNDWVTKRQEKLNNI